EVRLDLPAQRGEPDDDDPRHVGPEAITFADRSGADGLRLQPRPGGRVLRNALPGGHLKLDQREGERPRLRNHSGRTPNRRQLPSRDRPDIGVGDSPQRRPSRRARIPRRSAESTPASPPPPPHETPPEPVNG